MSTSMKSQRPGGRASLKTPLLSEAEKPERPWEHSSVREDVMHQFNLRLPEPLYVKLRHVSNRTHKSMQEICMPEVIRVIEGYIEEFAAEDARAAKAAERRAKAAARRGVTSIEPAKKAGKAKTAD